MTRHITDSERFTLAALNRKETELSEKNRQLKCYEDQLRAMKAYIGELKESNQILAAQVRYLVSNKINHA